VDVARANLSLKDVSNIPLPLPPFEEQREIVRILDKLLNHEDEARALIDMEEQIELIEKSILSKAFRGELGTNDPNDEPAIELLKKSLEGKAKTKSTKEKST
jgi:type I restriction enzyme S subunit